MLDKWWDEPIKPTLNLDGSGSSASFQRKEAQYKKRKVDNASINREDAELFALQREEEEIHRAKTKAKNEARIIELRERLGRSQEENDELARLLGSRELWEK